MVCFAGVLKRSPRKAGVSFAKGWRKLCERVEETVVAEDGGRLAEATFEITVVAEDGGRLA